MSEEQPALQQETNALPIKRRLPTWREMNMDTSPEAEAVLFKLWREAPAWRKLDWFRMGGEVSERQWRDVLGVMKTQHGSLDIDYLKAWAEKLNVTDLLEQALEEMTI
jgi:hypothetical protein